jgi:hypothetical protein
MTTDRSPVDDFIVCHRLAVANAYRRLSEAALRACEEYAAGLLPAEETAALARVEGRLEDVKHARVVLDAARRGRRMGEQAARERQQRGIGEVA